MTTKLSDWVEYYAELGISEDIASIRLAYARPFIEQRLPVIYGFDNLAEFMGLAPGVLAKMVSSPEHFYRTFEMQKRTGGVRVISAPYPSLLYCQRWILENILYRFAVHGGAYGFVPERNIAQNAQLHCGNSALFKTDIRDFFDSVTDNRVRSLYLSFGFPAGIAHYLTQLTCLNGSLPQGGAASPYLTNLICRRLDKRLLGFSRKHDLKYSRYADDIAISGSDIPESLPDVVRIILLEEGFRINPGKTTTYTGPTRKIVTGLDVSGDYPKPTRSFRRELTQELYYISKYGLFSHAKNKKIKRKFYAEVLRGKLNYWRDLNPNDSNYRKAENLAKIGGIL